MAARTNIFRHGFTLIEMSAVLVVIALLVGTILEGRSMIHNAQLQAAVNEFTKIGTAYSQFKQLYGGYKPGDFYNASGQKATDIWGSAGGTGQDAACFSALSLNAMATCNGDGNGYVAGPYSSGALTNANEIYLVFQQLVNAKMLEGKFSGNPAGGASIGKNILASQINNGGYMLLSQAPITDAGSATNSPYYFYGSYGTLVYNGVTTPGSYIVLGSVGQSVTKSASSSALPENELLTPADAYYLDKKMDDGKPAGGLLMSYFAYPDGTAIGATKCLIVASGTAVQSNTGGIDYNLSVTNQLCNVLYVNDMVTN